MDEALAIFRALQFGSAMLMWGTSAFRLFVAPPGLTRALDRSFRPIVGLAILVAAASSLGWLLAMAAQLDESWRAAWNAETLRAILFSTEFGRVWLGRLAITAGLIASLVLSRRHDWRIIALLSALYLGSLGLVGHAAAQTGAAGWLQRLNHAIHLLAAGFWMGSLLPLIACLWRTGVSALGADASVVLRRFSGFGHLAVSMVVATGVASTWLVLRAWPLDLSSRYQTLLLVKIGLVAAMIAIAVLNRYILVPRLRDTSGTLRLIRWTTVGEIALGVAVIWLVSELGVLSPA